jgi:glutaredoxin
LRARPVRATPRPVSLEAGSEALARLGPDLQRSPSMTTVTLYTKPDCCLCDEALEVIERVRREHRFTLEKVDITNDPSLLDRHAERIPVVVVNGVEAFLYRVDEQALRGMVAVPAGAAT